MSDLISRQEFMDELNKICNTKCPHNEPTKIVGACCALCFIDDVIEIVHNLPSAQSEPRKGKWIDTGSGQECDQCHEIQYGYDSGRRFCANCGARMVNE